MPVINAVFVVMRRVSDFSFSWRWMDEERVHRNLSMEEGKASSSLDQAVPWFIRGSPLGVTVDE
jgi:hypothetical protein